MKYFDGSSDLPRLRRSIPPVSCAFGTVTLTRAKFSVAERSPSNTLLGSPERLRVVAMKML